MKAVSSWVFLQFMGNKVWGLFSAVSSSVSVTFFLEILLDVSVFDLLMACSLNLFLIYILLL